jgi:hypothetical protein
VATASAVSAPDHPTLVAIRAAHHPGFDRVVFTFDGGLPVYRHAAYTDNILGEGSGLPIPVAGRAILGVHFRWAHQATPSRKAFALPNVMTAVSSGEFEAVFVYGLGVAKKTPFQRFTLRHPARVVVDVRAGFPTTSRKVFFFNRDRFVDNQQPFFVPRSRPVRTATPATGVMDRLFAGPLPGERANGLRLLRSEATGYKNLSIANGIARVQLTGGCNAGGSTVSIAGEIMPTLRQFGSVDWVKIYDPQGQTAAPNGQSDSIPDCLNP